MREKVGRTTRIEKSLALGFHVPVIGLSREAKQRLKWMDYYHKHKDVSLTCRYFGISRKTFYKWKNQYNPRNSYTLESKSKRPQKIRISQKLYDYGAEVARLRKENPTWSKYKIGALLRDKLNADISDTSVGYILKKKGLIDKKDSRKRKRARKRNSTKVRIRKAEININKPGALVQIDTKEYNSLGEGKLIQFTAIDCYSRKRVLRGYSRKTAVCGQSFLDHVIEEFPFEIEVILTDNGSEFKAEFDEACVKKGIKHYWTDPDSPNQNAYVESSHSIDQKEFYEVEYIPLGVSGFNQALKIWQDKYNSYRPHGSLSFNAPDTFLKSVKMKT